MGITKDKLVFTTACVAETVPKQERMIKWLAESCKWYDVPLRPYGMGHHYADWRQIKITLYCEALRKFQQEGFTHAFYTDGRDSFMLAGVDEIVQKYNAMGAPPYLVSCEDECYPFRDLSDKFPDPGHPWRYIGAGQSICEIKYTLQMWEELRKLYENIPDENHDQGWLELGYVEEVLNPNEFKLDTDCDIFQCVRAGIGKPLSESSLQVHGDRVYNRITGTRPCALHFPGGYSDPETGKDVTLVPVLKQLGRI